MQFSEYVPLVQDIITVVITEASRTETLTSLLRRRDIYQSLSLLLHASLTSESKTIKVYKLLVQTKAMHVPNQSQDERSEVT